MNDKTDHNTPQDDLEGFDTYEDALDTQEALAAEAGVDGDVIDDGIDDADFQDISDDLDADVFGEGEPAPAPKKKTNWFNIGVAVVAVAVAGGLIWSKLAPQMSGGGDMPPAAQSAGNNQQNGGFPTGGDPQAAAQQALSGTSVPPVSGGLLDNPDQFSALGAQNPSVPAPVETPPADPFAALSANNVAPANKTADAALDASPFPMEEAAVPMPAPIQPAPIEQAAPVAAPVGAPLDTVMPNPVAAPVIAPVAAEAAVVRDIAQVAPPAGLEGKVTSLESRLNDLDAKLESAIDKLENAASPKAAPVDDARLSSIQSSLERLESRLNTLSNAPARTQPAAVRAVERDVDEPAPVKAAAPKKSAPAAAKPAKTKAASASGGKWDAPYNPVQKAAPVRAAASSGGGGWELRGAQPGRAVIAASNGDIREVGVGDNVPGLGEVTGVASVNGRWVVQGTQGRLSQ